VVDPVLKWAGGKRSLATSIIKLFPLDYRDRRYHEPFFGGGALFFKIRPRSGSINDVNPDLMNFYRVVRDDPEDLISQAKNYTYDEEIYYNLRDRFNRRGIPAVERAALMLYLNKTSYNGLYRVNSRGEFNVPFGTYSNPTIVPEEKIRFASRLLRNVDILNEDFSYVSRCANEGNLCYLDPPYQPVGGTANFTSYSSGASASAIRGDLGISASSLTRWAFFSSSATLSRSMFLIFTTELEPSERSLSKPGDR